MQSAEMQSIVTDKASNIRNRCGDGYEIVSRMGQSRASAKVSAETYAAKKDNSKNNTILKAVRG